MSKLAFIRFMKIDLHLFYSIYDNIPLGYRDYVAINANVVVTAHIYSSPHAYLSLTSLNFVQGWCTSVILSPLSFYYALLMILTCVK